MASKQDGAGFRTPEDVARRYMGRIKLTQEEIEEIKRAIICDTVLSITSTAPVENRTITRAINNKVSKEIGKGLSSNDYTDTDKNKLENMPTITQADVDRWNQGGGGTTWIPPIGYIWISTASTDPGTIFNNTTWIRKKDTFLLAAGDVYSAGSTGGSSTHTLTTNEMPSHNHTITPKLQWQNSTVTSSGKVVRTYTNWSPDLSGNLSGNMTVNYSGDKDTTDNRGGGTSFSIMPPYTVVYVYERII